MLFRLRCGRLLEFASFGAPLSSKSSNRSIINILYHHGWPSTRHEAAFLHPHALDLGVRVIAINRPGVGLSSHNPAYSFAAVTDDVRQLLDELGLQRVVFMGTSGGGPYACACACLLPERTSAVCLLAGMTHTRAAPGLLQGMALSNRLGYLAINHAPALTGAVLGAGSLLLRLAGALGIGPVAAARRRQQQAEEPAGAQPEAASRAAEGSSSAVGEVGRQGVGRSADAAARDVTGLGGGTDVPGNSGEGSGGARVTSGAPDSSASDPGDEHARVAARAVTAPPAGPAAAAAAAVAAGAGGDGTTPGGEVGRAASGLGLSAAVTSLMLMTAGFPAVDRAAVARHMREHPELAAVMAAAGGEVAAQGLDGLWQDMRLTSEPWGLPLERITAPTFIWQGEADLNVTPAMARHLESTIPAARGRLRLVPGAGHISLGLQHGGEALREVVTHLRSADPAPGATSTGSGHGSALSPVQARSRE